MTDNKGLGLSLHSNQGMPYRVKEQGSKSDYATYSLYSLCIQGPVYLSSLLN